MADIPGTRPVNPTATDRAQTPGAKIEAIDPGLIRRALAGMMYAVTGRAPDWFGPGQPLPPQAPAAEKGRAFDYPYSANTVVRPRSNEPVTFDDLRGLAERCDLVRLAIETRKDQIEKLDWKIQPKLKRNEKIRGEADERCEALTKFFLFPDRRLDWNSWLRKALEDLFVIDAPTFYMRSDRLGRPYSLDIIDGATIKLVVDHTGRLQEPPDPAYQQVLKGLNATDYTQDELIYRPRNPRPHKFYGFSPVEQIILTINIALRRSLSQLNYFTDGLMPDLLIGVPETWTPENIRELQTWWDAMLSGIGANKRGAKFVPGGMQPYPIREPVVKDELDEWIARVVCYAFSLPPLPFVKMMNRGTAETSFETALQEGLEPLMQWVKGTIDTAIQKWWGYTDLEFVWDDHTKLKPMEQAQLNSTEMASGVLSVDEWRIEKGRVPYGVPAMIKGIGPSGFVFVEDLADPEVRAALKTALISAASPPPMYGPEGLPAASAGAADPLAGIDPTLLESVGLHPEVLAAHAGGLPAPGSVLHGVPKPILDHVDLSPDEISGGTPSPAAVAGPEDGIIDPPTQRGGDPALPADALVGVSPRLLRAVGLVARTYPLPRFDPARNPRPTPLEDPVVQAALRRPLHRPSAHQAQTD